MTGSFLDSDETLTMGYCQKTQTRGRGTGCRMSSSAAKLNSVAKMIELAVAKAHVV